MAAITKKCKLAAFTNSLRVQIVRICVLAHRVRNFFISWKFYQLSDRCGLWEIPFFFFLIFICVCIHSKWPILYINTHTHTQTLHILNPWLHRCSIFCMFSLLYFFFSCKLSFPLCVYNAPWCRFFLSCVKIKMP